VRWLPKDGEQDQLSNRCPETRAKCLTVPKEKSCGAVIFKLNENRQYLLLHYRGGHWDFVKGHVEKHELEKDTVRREVNEEVGLVDLLFVEGFRQPVSYIFKRGTNRIRKKVIFYLVESKISDVRISGEHVGFVWLPFDEAYKLLTFESAKETLQKAHARLETLSLRSKSGALSLSMGTSVRRNQTLPADEQRGAVGQRTRPLHYMPQPMKRHQQRPEVQSPHIPLHGSYFALTESIHCGFRLSDGGDSLKLVPVDDHLDLVMMRIPL
jgi:bis(5'-nucleosidyl)-tetraphosphatase